MALVQMVGLSTYADGLELAGRLGRDLQIRDEGLLLSAASALESKMTSDLERGLVRGYRLIAEDIRDGTASWLAETVR